jgi:hypothetical protein
VPAEHSIMVMVTDVQSTASMIEPSTSARFLHSPHTFVEKQREKKKNKNKTHQRLHGQADGGAAPQQTGGVVED